MNIKGNILSGLQGFGLGAILMAYVCNYNRSQLPVAVMCLVASVIFRVITKE